MNNPKGIPPPNSILSWIDQFEANNISSIRVSLMQFSKDPLTRRIFS